MNYEEKSARARQVGGNNLPLNLIAWVGEGIAILLIKTPIRPNHVTSLSLLLAVFGAWNASSGTPAGFFHCSLWLLISFILDCTDGRLARHKNLASRFGGYWDEVCDDFIPMIVTIGLLAGLVNAGYHELALLAPLFTYFGDTSIKHNMTRYRIEIVDRMPADTDLEHVFKDSLLLRLGRNLLPPIIPRKLVFPVVAFFGHGLIFILIDAVYTSVLAIAFAVMVGLDIKAAPSQSSSQT